MAMCNPLRSDGRFANVRGAAERTPLQRAHTSTPRSTAMRHPFLFQARSNARPPRNDHARRMSLERLEERQLLSSADFELSSLLPANGGDGSKGFVVNGTVGSGLLGNQFDYSPVGDINQDGIDDFLVTAGGDVGPTTMRTGYGYLIFGDSNGFPAELDLTSLNGTTGYEIDGTTVGDRTGVYGGGAGDVNGDGIPDLVIGAPLASPSSDRDQGWPILRDLRRRR